MAQKWARVEEFVDRNAASVGLFGGKQQQIEKEGANTGETCQLEKKLTESSETGKYVRGLGPPTTTTGKCDGLH